MIYIILSVICSVSVGVLIKIARRFEIDFVQIITLNYISAIFLCYFSYQPEIPLEEPLPWNLYIPLGIFLPSVFFLLAMSVKHMGIVKTDIVQRLSLFIPVLASVFIFNEQFSTLKILGLLLAFVAIYFILTRKENLENAGNNWLYPAMVMVGFGIADVLFKSLTSQTHIPYTTSLFIVFCLSLLISSIFSLYSIFFYKKPFSFLNVAFGLFLGLLNFGNILFYLKAHDALSESPTTVFASMNLGVIIAGTLIGIFYFKEKITPKNYIGIALAILAIVLITLSKLH
ncbi:EamA family transporter [Flavobacterium sp. NST-5]|uniref:EamA family transporter n=1 Tax=Flavobacterium ichthyis TaxID=2698827 RepID=A0ABW9ZAP1_9FLAO|nr:DMT family transporter [Flavobacterium ichthyis]NBL65201.1 EamA family transporter [Flavobacterium ichthyis]